jgi:hypothetical protein
MLRLVFRLVRLILEPDYRRPYTDEFRTALVEIKAA